MNDPPSETVHLLERLRAGDRRALADLFQRHRDRLRRMVELRMDARLQGRVDASDVLQDGFLDLAKRVESYLSDPRLPVFLWLRLVVSDRLAMSTAATWGRGCGTPPRRSRSIAIRCPRPARRPWPRCSWGV